MWDSDFLPDWKEEPEQQMFDTDSAFDIDLSIDEIDDEYINAKYTTELANLGFRRKLL